MHNYHCQGKENDSLPEQVVEAKRKKVAVAGAAAAVVVTVATVSISVMRWE